jgi:hypothetical protein
MSNIVVIIIDILVSSLEIYRSVLNSVVSWPISQFPRMHISHTLNFMKGRAELQGSNIHSAR